MTIKEEIGLWWYNQTPETLKPKVVYALVIKILRREKKKWLRNYDKLKKR